MTAFRAALLWPLTLKGPGTALRLFQAIGAALAVSLAWRVPGGWDLALPLAGFLIMAEVALLARRLRKEG